MNHLTTIKPKNTNIANVMKTRIALAKANALKDHDPTLEECQESVYAIYRAKLINSMPQAMREIYNDFNALMIGATPKAEVVMNQVKKIKLGKTDLIEAYTPNVWEQFTKAVQARYLKALRLDEEERKEEMRYIKAVFDAQQKVSVEIDDDLFLKFDETAESILAFPLDRIDSHILPDFDKKEATAMRASDIYRYLLPRSKGTIQQTPQQLANLLPALGYEYFERRVKGKPVKYYYVELVK